MIQFVDAMSRQLTKWMTKGSEIVKRQTPMFDIVPSLLE